MMTKVLTGISALMLAGTTFFFLPEKKTMRAYTPRSEQNSNKVSNSWEGAARHYELIRANRATGKIDINDVLRAEQESFSRLGRGNSAVAMNFEEVGPDNIGGRTRAILVDRTVTDGSRVYAGSVSGGLFVSNNAGGTWQPVNDQLENLNISTLAQAPNGDIYVGTGASFDGASGSGGSGFLGRGLWKYNGSSWTHLVTLSNLNSSSEDWSMINRVSVDPNNSSNVFAATKGGIKFSSDGGSTWTAVQNAAASCNIDLNNGQDVLALDNGVVLVVSNGILYRSTTPLDACSYIKVTSGVPNSSQRMVIATSLNHNDYVYALTVAGGVLQGVYKSTDYGNSFTNILSPIPGYFEPMGGNGQGYYDLALGVFPDDPNSILIGGVELWKYNGNLTRIAAEFAGQFSSIYVHSDKHCFEFDPFDPAGKTFYVGSDGGIGKSQDGGNSFTVNNRGYDVTQYYNIAMMNADISFGGAQDNGTTMMLGTYQDSVGVYLNTPLEGLSIIGGDGFMCEYSWLTGTMYGSIYGSDVRRANSTEGQNMSFSAMYCDDSPTCNPSNDTCCGRTNPFYTKFRLWETNYEPLSQATITFASEYITNGDVGTGTGSKKTFTGTINKLQQSGSIIPGEVRFGTVSDTIGPDANITTPVDTLNSAYGTGTINYSTGAYSITFTTPPSVNIIVNVTYALSYNAGDVLNLLSNTGNIPINYTLPAGLTLGDSITIQDPVQSMMALYGQKNDVLITRGALDFSSLPKWWKLGGNPTGFGITAMEFSEDGDYLYIGNYNGALYRYSGLRSVYSKADANALQPVMIASLGSQSVTGISVHPTDPDKLIVTAGNYGNTDYVYRITNGTTAGTNGANKTSIQGSNSANPLPEMPVYSAQIDALNPDVVVIGTEYGVWATDGAFSTTNGVDVEWSNESATLANVPVFDVRQQRLDWHYALNHEMYYIGTHGRGLWKSSSLVGTPEEPKVNVSKYLWNLSVYPNPANRIATISFNVAEVMKGSIGIYDLNGKLVKTLQRNQFEQGNNTVSFNVSTLSNGTYFVMVNAGEYRQVAKFMVTK